MLEAGLNRKDGMLSRIGLWLTLAWCGSVIMAFEVLGARLLMPGFGSGIDLWAWVMGATLGALALGYWAGGRMADAWPFHLLLELVLLAGGVCLVAIRFVGPDLVWRFSSIRSSPSLGAGVCSILALPLALLGSVQPPVMKLLLAETPGAGRLVGNALAVGTAGGVAGAL